MAARHTSWQVLRLLSGIGSLAAIWAITSCTTQVLAIGGSCGDGSTDQATPPCPSSIGLILPIAIVGMMLMIGVNIVATYLVRGRQWGLLAWSVLFLSLGWNFFQTDRYPTGVADPDIGYLVTGSVFAMMGITPLVALLWRFVRHQPGRPTRLPSLPNSRG